MTIQGKKKIFAVVSAGLVISSIIVGALLIHHFVIHSKPKISQFENNYATLTGHASPVFSVAFSPDDSLLASGSVDGTVRLWNVSNGALIHVLRQQASSFSVAFSPDGAIIAASSIYTLRTSNDSYESCSRIKLWDVASGSILQTLRGNGDCRGFAFSPNGKMLAGGEDSVIKLWNITSGAELYNLTGHTKDVNSVAFSPDGAILASGSWDNTVKLWDVTSGSLLQTLTGHTDCPQSVAFSPDGAILASGSRDNTVKLWDVASGSLLQNLTGHCSKVFSVAFSPDGKTLASGCGNYNDRDFPSIMHNATIELWDVSSGKELTALVGHTNVVMSVAFSSDGSRLASGSWDWTVKLWGNYDPIVIPPNDDWTTSSPEEQGMSSTQLDHLFDMLEYTRIHGLVIVRHGVVVAEGYYSDLFHQYIQDDKHQLHSVTKSITSALVGIAIDNGFIENVNQKVLAFFPEKNFTNVDSRKEAMTLEHLLTMTTGLQWPEWETGYESPEDLADQMLFCEDSVQFILDKPMITDPGTEFNYNSGASHLQSAIIQRTTGYSTLEFAQKYLFNPLGIKPADVVWDTDYQGIARGHSNLFLSPVAWRKLVSCI